MRNPGNRIVVWYRGVGFRIRSCQSTVNPEEPLSFNDWSSYIKASLEVPSTVSEKLLVEAKVLIRKQTVKK